jgi:ribosome maturation factor RimP
VKVRTTEPIAGARNHAGALVSADAEAIVVATEGGELRVRYEDIASARTVADWDAELKRSSAT